MRYVMFVLDMSFNIVDMVWVDCQNMTTHPHHVDNVNGHTEDNTLQVVCAPQFQKAYGGGEGCVPLSKDL